MDITHYKSLTRAEEQEIENCANRLISECVDISKGFMDKAEAEKQYGFSLYQGGVVPGNQLRVVNIAGVDTEACCGTHADNTAEVGWVKIMKSQRISDGIVRLYYVARERAMNVLNQENTILTNLCKSWSVEQSLIEETASKFFSGYKRLTTRTQRQDQQIFNLQIKFLMKDDATHPYFVKSDLPEATLYISCLSSFAEDFKAKQKGIIFVSPKYLVGFFGNPQMIDVAELEKVLQTLSSKPLKLMKKDKVTKGKGK